MIFDKQNLFSDAQAVTVTAPSTDVIDTAGGDKGGPEEIFLAVVADVTHTAGGAANLTITLQTDDAEGFGTAETLVTSRAFAIADLVAGMNVWQVAVPRGAKRYLRLNYDVGTGPFTAGAITAGLVKDAQAFKAYPRGYTVGA